MSRWILFAGCLALILAAGVNGAAQAQSTLQSPATAQVGQLFATPIVIPPIPPDYPPLTPAYAPYILRLTSQESGGVFQVPVGTLIYVYVPRFPYTRLDYDPTILRESFRDPLPIQPIPQDGPQIAPLFPPWRLISIAPGTTSLNLESVPCPYGQPCPKMPILAFHVTIVVTGFVYPPSPTPMPPAPPIGYNNPDVYIGTAFLGRTVLVQPGQIVALDLPFLAPGESVTLGFDSGVLTPLPGQDLTHPQAGGWLFRMAGAGTTQLTVQTNRCLDGSGQCTPSMLFNVTISSGD